MTNPVFRAFVESCELPGVPNYVQHNDLNNANVIYNPELNEITLIDFEFSGYNPFGFDIAGILSECLLTEADDGTWSVDEAGLPQNDEIVGLLKIYISELRKNLEGDSGAWLDELVPEDLVEYI